MSVDPTLGYDPESPVQRVRDLVEYGTAIRAAEAADTLAAYLQSQRPDLEESILSIRELGAAIRRSLPKGEPHP
jgi:hypothetical protein